MVCDLRKKVYNFKRQFGLISVLMVFNLTVIKIVTRIVDTIV